MYIGRVHIYKVFEHSQVVMPVGEPGTNPLCIARDAYTYSPEHYMHLALLLVTMSGY